MKVEVCNLDNNTIFLTIYLSIKKKLKTESNDFFFFYSKIP